MANNKFAALGFEERVSLESGAVGELDVYVFPQSSSWEDIKFELDVLKPYYEEVRLLEKEIEVFSKLEEEGRLNKPVIVFDLKEFIFGEDRQVWLRWATEVAGTLIVSLDWQDQADILFTDKKDSMAKGKKVIYIAE